MEHILLQNAFKYRKRGEISLPEKFSYDKGVGAWICNEDKSLLINHADFPTTGSKKFDVETGEDHKGQ